MEHRDSFILEALIDFCDRAESGLKELGVETEEDFLRSLHAQDLCSFYIFQIGEHVVELSDKFIDLHPEIEWRKIRGFRNVIGHDYGSVDEKILWKTVNERLPELRNFCARQIGAEE
ncbi:DUF86 domain-containing protein [Candidatus Saccharibacteria bacterium]|nr:DUF86 domain-containing protein [Candidatus Saccharibacteria bacterium]